MPEWKIGDRIENRYEIHQILRGGMGVVYICYDHQDKVPYALKTFQDRYFKSQQMREHFIREARTWIELEKHQNIVRAYWVENIQGKLYIGLEYIANPELGGADLGRWIRRGMEVSQALNFAVQFCDGMDYAHKKVGMVHRDIKPGNILVTQDMVVKITDFGLVKTALAEASREDFLETAGEEAVSDGISFTRTGMLMGTPPYMSPEQCRNATEVDIRSDIYSFGAVLYEMLTGRWIFEAATSLEFVRCHLYEPPPSPASLNPDLPQNLEDVLLCCLSKNPEQRYSNFSMLREKLAGIYHGLTGEEIAPSAEGDDLEAWEWGNKGYSLAALGRRKEAILCYDRTLDIDPTLIKAWSNKGASLTALGHHEEAIACCDRALETEPRYANAWSIKGAALNALGHLEEAIVCYDSALKVDHRYTDAWYNKGNSLAALARYEEAITCYNRVLDIEPRYVNALLNKGNVLSALRRYKEAIICCDRILEIDHRHTDAWYNKGNSLAALARYEEAIHCYERTLEIDPRYAPAWSNKGISLSELGRNEEAIHCYDRALEIDPRYAQAWYNKGVFLFASRHNEEAIYCYERALEIDPRYAQAWSNKGVSLSALGCNEEAIHCYERTLEIDPRNVNAWFNKGIIFANSGRFQEALGYFIKILEFDPDNTNAKQGIAFCQQRLKQG